VSTVLIEVGLPTAEELERIVDAWFDAQPLESAYACFAGDQEASDEINKYDDLNTEEQDHAILTATRYLWLRAARKRAAKNR
jgi:hypothetical protein